MRDTSWALDGHGPGLDVDLDALRDLQSLLRVDVLHGEGAINVSRN